MDIHGILWCMHDALQNMLTCLTSSFHWHSRIKEPRLILYFGKSGNTFVFITDFLVIVSRLDMANIIKEKQTLTIARYI